MFDVRVQKNYVGPTLSFDDFLVSQLRLNLTVRVLSDRKRKSDFPLLGKNPTTSLFDVLSYGDFGFISWGNQEKNNRTQIRLHDTIE